MSVQLLVSPPASGKTHTCIERIHSVLDEKPLAEVWAVLPDQLQATAFRRRLAESGGVIGARVITFGSLYQEILAKVGQSVPLASDPIAQHLVKITIDDLYQQGELPFYDSIRTMPGFTLALYDHFAELKRALVRPETFLNETSLQPARVIELACLYASYQTRLIQLGWADSEGLSWLAVAALQADPHLVNDWVLLVVDGFDLFTHTQIQALKLLAGQVQELIITLPGSESMARPAHRRFAQSLGRLRTDLAFSVQPLREKPNLPGLLCHLEQNLFEPGSPTSPQPPKTLDQDPEIIFLEARSPTEEAREALRWIKSRIVRDRILPQGCAIFTPDPDIYHFPLKSAAREFGIRLQFLSGEKLAAAPPIAVLLDLLKLQLQNFPRRQLLDTIRSPYLELTRFGLHPWLADLLDRVSCYGQVIESIPQWDEVFDRLAVTQAEEGEDLDGETTLPDLPHGQQARQMKNALHLFADRLAPSVKPQSLHSWVSWLEDLLAELAYLKDEANPLDEAIQLELGEILRSLVLSDTLTDSPSFQDINYQQFITELETALQRATYQEPDTSWQSAVLVGPYDVARGIRFQAVALLGLAEGVFPRVERADPFLDEPLRQRLGLEPHLGREQAGLFYQAVTRADRCLLLTRPYLADDGESWEASPYWSAAIRLFPERKPVRIQPDSLRPLSEAASPQEALFWAVLQDNLPADFLPELGSSWDQVCHGWRVLQESQTATPRGVYQGYTPSLAVELHQRYGPGHTWSASRLEAYGCCPYRFFIEVGLELQVIATPEPGFNAPQLGSLMHEILREVYQQAQPAGDLNSALDILPQAAQRIFKEAPDRYGFRPSLLWEVEQNQLVATLEKTIRSLSELEGGWFPIALEQIFGIGDTPGLDLDIKGEHIRLHGIIDRVDQNSAGQLRVIDYKTGSSHLAASDFIDGRRLQLPLYALAARDALNLGEPVEGLYWAILANKPGSLKLSKFSYENYFGFDGTISLLFKHLERSLAGIYQGVFPPNPPDAGCPSYCAASAWCWRYTA